MPHLPRILLSIEDDEDDEMFIKEAVEELNLNLSFVATHDGREALSFLSEQKLLNNLPLLILLDLNMPFMDGKQTLAEIKKDPFFKSVPIAVFTTSSNSEDFQYFETFGVKMLTKPDHLTPYKETVKKAVTTHCAF